MRRGWIPRSGVALLLLVSLGSLVAVAVDPVEVIYYQDFSSGMPTYWDTTLTTAAERWVGEGEYNLLVHAPYHTAHGLLLQRAFEDGRFALDVTQHAGTPHASYGIVIRFRDPGTYYRFAISGDGYFELVHCQAGRCGYMIYRKRCYVLQLGCGTTNRLELIADGCQFTCYVNGAKLAQISDRCLTRGSLGVFVETLFTGGVHVGFDNVVVTALTSDE